MGREDMEQIKREILHLRKRLYEYSSSSCYCRADLVELSEQLDVKILKYMEMKHR